MARRLTDQARMLLGYAPTEDNTEGEGEGEPLDIDAVLAKQAEHPLNRQMETGRPQMETKGRVVGDIAGIVHDAIGFVSFNPSEHPRDYRGRFLSTGDDVDLPDGRQGVIETLNPDGSMTVRTNSGSGGITSANAPEVRRVNDIAGISVDIHDGRQGIADRVDESTGDVVVRLPDKTEVPVKPADLTPAPTPSDAPVDIQYGVDGKIIQGAGVRDDAGHIGVAMGVNDNMVIVNFGGDTRTIRASALKPTAGSPDSEFPSPLDERLVNFKPSRNLDDPAKTAPLAELLPNARYQAYSQVPFLADMHARMGVEDPLTHDVSDYMARRDALFDAQPLSSVPYDKVVVTQKSVNRDRVSQIAMDPSTGGTKPAHFVRYNGETYVLNGHHRVAAQIINGDNNVTGRVLNLDIAKAEDPTIDPFAAAGPDAAGLPTGIGRGAVVLLGNGQLAFIADASDASRMRAWNDDARKWVTISVGDIGSVRVLNTDPGTAQTESLIRTRAKDAGLLRIDRPPEIGADLPDNLRPRGALIPVDGVDGVASLGDGAVPRMQFMSLMFNDNAPESLDPSTAAASSDVQRRGAAFTRAVDGVAPGMAEVPEPLMAELTNMPVDATYALTPVGGVIKITEPHRAALASVPGVVMDVPGNDPRIAAYRRRELAGQYINMWYMTSGDATPRAIAMQNVASDLFGTDAKSTSFNPMQDVAAKDAAAHEDPAMRAFLAATYAQTQAYLSKNGIDAIVGYRGSSFRRGSEPDWTHQPQTEDPMRPLSSWTASPTHAIRFEGNLGEDGVGAIRAARIPRDRILSIPVTGPGAFGEYEMVVLAGPGISTVVDPIGEPATLAQGAIDDVPDSPTWRSPTAPISDMPPRDELEVPVHGTDVFPWKDWADFNLKGLPSTDQGMTKHVVMGVNRSDAKAQVVSDLTKAMDMVPDEAMFRGVDDGITNDVTQVGIYTPVDGSVSFHPDRGPQTYDPEGYTSMRVLPVDDPRVRAARRTQIVNAMVAQWANTSNDSSAESLAIQEIAAEHFGVTDGAEWDMEAASMRTGSDALRSEIDRIKANRGDAMTAFVQAQYDATQRRYAAAGITKVDLYRGMGWAGSGPEQVPDWAKVDGDANIALRPLSSWTLDRDTADQFGRNTGQGGIYSRAANVIIGATVPVERILATPRTGVGSLSDWEVVVLGGKTDVAVRTSVIPPLTDAEANDTPPWLLKDEADFQTAVRMATTPERRRALMERATQVGGWPGMIPAEWRPKNTGLSQDGLTFEARKDEESQNLKVDRMRRAAKLSIAEIEAGTARDLHDALVAEMYGDVYHIERRSDYQGAKRRADLAALLDSGKFHLPRTTLPDDWRNP